MFTETNLSSFLLELLDGSLVDSSALVDQVAGRGGLAGVDMANDHDVDVDLFLSHFNALVINDMEAVILTFKMKYYWLNCQENEGELSVSAIKVHV